MAPWATPAPLEGIKSRKRGVFSIDFGDIAVGSGVSRLSGVRLTLESRVVADGKAGRAVAEVLLGQGKLAAGKVQRHDSLLAVHLGPHLAAAGGAGATWEQHVASIEAELQQSKPQVVVLDEKGDAAWAQAVAAIVASPEVRAFRGAVVVCLDSESALAPAVEDLCKERWVGVSSWLWQERLARGPVDFMEDVLGAGGEGPGCAGADAGVDGLLREASALSGDCFREDTVAKARDRGWELSLLTKSTPGEGRQLCGFICVTMVEKRSELHIARLAVPPECRDGGYGQWLMRWVLQRAAGMPASRCAWISLSALDTAVPFYERYGFTDMTCDAVEDPDHFQTWMELQNRPEAKLAEPEVGEPGRAEAIAGG